MTVLLSATNVVPLATGLVFLLAVLVFTGISNGAELKRHLPVNLIMVIVGALGLAAALQQSGLINSINALVFPLLEGSSPFVALVAIYLLTLLLTELVTNNAAAALMFPFAWGLVQMLDAPVLPFALAVAFAASASFISPWGYQTNLLVFSAANYKLSHFVRIGLPISILYSVIILLLLKVSFGL